MIGLTPHVSVVVPALNAADTIAAQLEALARQDFDGPWELVVVDNGSNDATTELALAARVHQNCVVRVILEPRRGLNVARNRGISEAHSGHIAICDADDIVAAEWLRVLTVALADHDVVAGSLAVTDINPADVLALRGWMDVTSPLPTVGREFGFLDQVLCGNVAFHRRVWESIGGFDEAFSRGGDDVDFGWRAQLAGFSVSYRADAVLHYRARGDRWLMFRQYVRDGQGSAHLYSRYRAKGMPGRPVTEFLRTAVWILRKLPLLWRQDSTAQGHMIRVAGKQWGRIKGSVRHRVRYL